MSDAQIGKKGRPLQPSADEAGLVSQAAAAMLADKTHMQWPEILRWLVGEVRTSPSADLAEAARQAAEAVQQVLDKHGFTRQHGRSRIPLVSTSEFTNAIQRAIIETAFAGLRQPEPPGVEEASLQLWAYVMQATAGEPVQRTSIKAILTALVASEAEKWRGHYEEMLNVAKLQTAEGERDTERAENQLADEFRHAASMRAVAMWREATGRELAMPDQADMEVWLLTMIDDLTAKLEKSNFDRKQAENIEKELIGDNKRLLDALGALVTPDNEFPCIPPGPERDELERVYQEIQRADHA